MAGSACHAAATAVREKWSPRKLVLNVPSDRLELAGGRVYDRDAEDRGISLGELSGRRTPFAAPFVRGPNQSRKHGTSARQRGSTRHGVHAVIVEVDPETATVGSSATLSFTIAARSSTRCWRRTDSRRRRARHRNSFYEKLMYDEQGQLLNASFMDYLLPTATDVPPIETAHRETPSPYNVVGLKGVGEAGCIPTGAVFAQAVEDALAGSGVEITEIPLSPNLLFELIQAARK